jgi:hypothetical protein
MPSMAIVAFCLDAAVFSVTELPAGRAETTQSFIIILVRTGRTWNVFIRHFEKDAWKV